MNGNTTTAGAVIEARGVTFSYQSEPVLSHVDFSVNRGDFVSIIGANGAGKSTLLRLLLGELSPDSGEILLMGQPLAHFRDWPEIGYVPQNGTTLAAGFPATVFEVVSMGRYSKIGPLRFAGKRHKQQVGEALAAVEMQAFSTRMIGELSGGQTQRVLIARALAAESAVLLLDEPTTGVDSASTLALYELLQALGQKRSLTVVMVTHDVARAGGYANRTLCLEHGSMVELSEEELAHELAHKHQHPQVKRVKG